jgi:type IV pilus assembly protein PilC
MATKQFTYTAMDGQGKEQRGRIEADSEQDAAARLRQSGLFATSVKEAKAGGGGPAKAAGGAAGAAAAKKGGLFAKGGGAIKRKHLTTMTRQLSTLLEAGLPLVRALRTLERQAKDDHTLRRVMGELAASVEGGSTFTEAVAGHPKSFNKLYVNMVRAGEASGSLELTLKRLAEFMEKAQRIAGKVKSAMIYPVVVLCVALLITAGLMIFIVPKFSKIFADLLPDGTPLPGLTLLVMGISKTMTNAFWPIFPNLTVTVGIVVGIVVSWKTFKATKGGVRFLDNLALRVPPFNQLVVRSTVARFCRTLGTLMQSGVAVLQALQIVKDTSGNEVVADAIQKVHDSVKEGESMSRPLENTGVFPGMMVSMVEVGEETGALPEMLNRVADIYEEEVDRAVEGLTSLIEPFMIVFLAVIIGGIVIALFLPMIKIITTMTGGGG